MSPATKLIAAIAVLAIGAFITALSMPVRGAPEVRFVTLSGERFSTSDLRGKVAIVNFWATNCSTCVAEMPQLEATWRKFAPYDFDMVAVALKFDPPEQVSQFARRNALPFKVALDSSGEAARKFGNVHITPTTFVLDRRGRVIRRFQGEPDWNALHAVLEKALAEKI